MTVRQSAPGHDGNGIEERLAFRPVEGARWSDLERLFETRGAPHHCWCMVWRDMPRADRRDKARKKAALRRRVADGVPVGLLAYLDDEPVAWCSIAPRPTYRRLSDIGDPEDGQVWAIVCFFVLRAYRGRGLAARLIAAAGDYARSRGARVLEAYPVANDAPSYRFMGIVETFERAGFEAVGRSGTRRTIMRRTLA